MSTLLVSAGFARAGSICGTVRDGVSLQPVSNAAVFLFDDLDQYTGLYAGTDVDGHYCINSIPVGTYTIQIRVDDFLSAVVRGVFVDEDTAVDVTTHPPLFLGQPWPNPARNEGGNTYIGGTGGAGGSGAGTAQDGPTGPVVATN